jgi:Rieske Fe-S protein
LGEQLQRDPITRSQFLWMGTLGTLVGAVLTVPPLIYFLDPSIKNKILKRSDIPNDWLALGSIFEVPADEPKTYRVSFPRSQTYALPKEEGSKEGSLTEAVLVSWQDGRIPDILNGRGREGLSGTEIEELSQKLNVLSNHCAHLGCPVRWLPEDGQIVCPCHGGLYDINGGYIGGPPPHGLYPYAFEIREDGSLYIKHEFTKYGTPYVV